MILRLSDSLSRGLIVVVALGVTASLSFLAVRMALAAAAAEKESAPGLQFAARLEPKNPEYWYRLGHYQQFNLELPDSSTAEESFGKAIALDPQYTDAWLDLGTAYELDGRLGDARDAYVHAKKSYPVSAEVSWRYGNFLLRQGDAEAAYPEFRRSLESDPRRAASAFSRCYRANPDVDVILDKVLPPIPSVYVDVIAETTASKQLALAQIVWKRLISLHPRLTIRDVEPLVAALLLEKDYVEAQRVWNEGAQAMYLPALLPLPGSVVWDPSFESNISNASFSWHFYPLTQGVTTGFDTAEKLSGNQSLRVSFDGKSNPSIEPACTSVFVTPSTKYHFSAWIKTKELTTDQGVAFRVRSFTDKGTEATALHSRALTGTNPWTLVDLHFATGPDEHRASICVWREHSYEPDVHMAGTAWLDDVNLVPEAPGEPVRP
jgi:tetratricopeptide (TPR) repeat protein